MKCYNDDQIFDFINKELPEDDLNLIEKHIQECSICNEIYNQKLEEINSLTTCFQELDHSVIHIPEFVFPNQEQEKKSLQIKPLIIKLSIAATLLIFISISILLLNQKKKNNFELQLVQMQAEILISDMNESWHNRDLIFTQTNTETGKTNVFLSSEIELK